MPTITFELEDKAFCDYNCPCLHISYGGAYDSMKFVTCGKKYKPVKDYEACDKIIRPEQCKKELGL